jgi:hypothetical protein
MAGHHRQERPLIVVGEQRLVGVARHQGEAEPLGQVQRAAVGFEVLDRKAGRLGARVRDHLWREVDADAAESARGDRDGEPPGATRQVEHRPAVARRGGHDEVSLFVERVLDVVGDGVEAHSCASKVGPSGSGVSMSSARISGRACASESVRPTRWDV